jgi:hypothetical protein
MGGPERSTWAERRESRHVQVYRQNSCLCEEFMIDTRRGGNASGGMKDGRHAPEPKQSVR